MTSICINQKYLFVHKTTNLTSKCFIHFVPYKFEFSHYFKSTQWANNPSDYNNGMIGGAIYSSVILNHKRG